MENCMKNCIKNCMEKYFDAHLHLPCYDNLFTFEDKKNRLLQDIKSAGVAGGIVIADSELTSSIGTTEECVDLFSDCENIFVVGGISPLIDYENRLQVLERLLVERKIVGLKLYPGHEPYFMDDERLAFTFDLCMKFDVPLLVHTGWDNSQYNHPKYFASIAEKNPAMRIVMCHLWWPDIDVCYEVTERFSNVYYDISSLAHDKNLISQTALVLDRIAKEHPGKLILGSDYGMCSIEEHIGLIKSLDVFDVDCQTCQKIFWGNAFDVYGIGDYM